MELGCSIAEPHDAGGLSAETSRPEARRGKLVCLVGRDVGATHDVGGDITVLGRGPDADILLADPNISRAHARICRRGANLILEDLGSANGTQVNGTAAIQHVLRPGDRIQLGGTTMLIYVQLDDLEERVARVQRLDALGELAAGLVHEFRNQVTVAAGNIDFLHDRLPELVPATAEVRDALRDARTAVAAAVAITNRIARLAPRDRSAPAVVAMDSLITEVLVTVRRSFGASIQVHLDVEPDLEALADRDDLAQAIHDVCLNAREAMPRGGRLTISARRVAMDRAQAAAHQLPGEGAYAELAVRDTGHGMTDEVRARVFEPFFTTKPKGHGIGLSLATVYSMVRGLGGCVEVESAPGQGTCLRLLLPATLAG